MDIQIKVDGAVFTPGEDQMPIETARAVLTHLQAGIGPDYAARWEHAIATLRK